MTEKIRNWFLSWSGFLTVTTVFYLAFELAFNAYLLDVVGVADPSVAADRVEFYGRLVSASGFTLLVWKLMPIDTDGGKVKRIIKMILVPIVVGAVAWVIMFFGQKWVVDEWIVKQTTEEQRYKAQQMVLLKQGLGSGRTEIEGLPYDFKNSSPTDRTFLAMSGAFIFTSPDYLKLIEQNQRKILEGIIEFKAYQSFDTSYQRYEEGISKFRNAYDQYRQASKKLFKTKKNARKTAQEHWVNMMEKLRGGFHSYKNAREKIAEKISEEEEAKDLLQKFLKRLRRCGSVRNCNAIDLYHKYASRYIDNPPSWSYWCTSDGEIAQMEDWLNKSQNNEHLNKIATVLVFSALNPALGGIVGVMAIADYFAPKNNQNHPLPNCQQLSTKRSLINFQMYKLMLKRKTGYPPSITSFEDFLESDVSVNRIKNRASSRGVNLSDSWTLNHKSEFMDKAVETIRERADAHYRNRIQKVAGGYIEPGLTWQNFYRHDVVQTKVRDYLDQDFVEKLPMDLDQLPIDLSKKEFKEHIIKPYINQETQHRLGELKEHKGKLGEEKEHQTEGREYVRAVIVPPVALILSLFFGLTHFLITVSRKLIVPLVDGFVVMGKKRLLIYATILVFVGVSIFPFFFENKFTKNQHFQELFEHSRKQIGVTSYALSWIVRAEPLTYPIGNNMKILIKRSHQVLSAYKQVLLKKVKN